MQERVRAYYQLTKPGVLYGNVLSGVAGFFLAAAGDINWVSFFSMLVGMSAVIASACVINNYLDQDIDIAMERTKKRPSVTGSIPGWAMVAYSFVLFIIGITALWFGTNVLTVIVGLLGFVTYVWLYGALSKRRSIHGTLVGSISGAMPILGGYTAAANVIDIGAILVFLIIFFWQFPEFYSIAIYRRKEYAAAKIPVMPVVKGIRSTIIQIFIYTILYVLSTLALTFYGYTGFVYAAVMLIVGARWIMIGYEGLHTKSPDKWARKMFKFSMISILILCVMLSVGPLLP